MSDTLDRASVVDKNFITKVKNSNLPNAKSNTTPAAANLTKHDLLALFESQLLSRHLDLAARILKQKNLSFYTIGSSGHEGNAAIAKAFRLTDMAFLHYRSGGFYIERARQQKNVDPVYDIALSLVASKQDPISNGRHKVFGSKALFIPPQTSTIASHLPKAVGTALAITRAKELKMNTEIPDDSVILCSFGDASVNHASAQSTLNTACWITHVNYPLPIVFICEDNGIGISVPTPQDWIESMIRARDELTYIACDGLNLADVYNKAKLAENLTRNKKKPVFLHMRCPRLLGHAGSDIEFHYHTLQQIEAIEADDPLLHSSRILLENQFATKDEILALYETARQKVLAACDRACNTPRLTSQKEVMDSIIPNKSIVNIPKFPPEQTRKEYFKNQYEQLNQPRNLAQLINFTLTDLMLQYSNIVLFGEDVGKKGGVYRVTADLQARFGQRRVFDTLLDEQTILGTAIGFAMNGFIPIPEIQFLAYFHNACDQIRGEAATLSFFSNGQYTNPMVVRIPGLAYQKGFGGHFHNDNTIAVFRDIPGIIVACPSNGKDAVKMLRTAVKLAYAERRIVIFIEPIALYMTKDLHNEGDNLWLATYPTPDEQIELGEVGLYGNGTDLAIITYGNGYYLSRQAEKILAEKYKINTRIIDLRWLAPLPIKSILNAISDCKHILIVDECRHTGSNSEALMAMLLENLVTSPVKRVTAADCFIPLGTAWQYVLPSRDDIIRNACALLNK